MMKRQQPIIAVVDNGIHCPSINCFNQLVDVFPQYRFKYFAPPRIELSLSQAQNPRLPAAAGPADLYILLGSASHVTHHRHWHRPLFDWAINRLQNGRPMMGICFGHQLMAYYLGKDQCVDFHHKPGFEKTLTEVRKVTVTKGLFGLKEGESFQLPFVHGQSITKLPQQMEVVGNSPGHDFDLVSLKGLPFLGVQAHPEASQYFLHEESLALNPLDRAQVLKDGMRFIGTFFQHHLG